MDEQFERICFCHQEGDPTTLREADRGHTLWVDEGLASQEGERTIGIRPAHAGDVRGKRTCTLGLGQIPLYVVAHNEPARNEPLIGAFKLYALQRRGPCVSHLRTYDAP